MFHRIGLSVDDEEWKRVQNLQRRLRIKSRSRFFREIVRRYEKLETAYRSLEVCRLGYLRIPEKPNGDALPILRANLRGQKAETW